jgi:hypothetical protein
VKGEAQILGQQETLEKREGGWGEAEETFSKKIPKYRPHKTLKTLPTKNLLIFFILYLTFPGLIAVVTNGPHPRR